VANYNIISTQVYKRGTARPNGRAILCVGGSSCALTKVVEKLLLYIPWKRRTNN